MAGETGRIGRRGMLAWLAGAAALGALAGPGGALAEAREVIDARVRLAMAELRDTVSGIGGLEQEAKAVLVMPEVVKGGFIVGGSYGEGALLGLGGAEAQTLGYYSVAAASIGLQAGIQKSGHALYFLTDDALSRFRRSDGWEVGADAEVTLLDGGGNVGVSSTAYQKPIVAIVFGADGLLLGASLEGAKYSPIQR